jgi:hypothetical protein
MYPTIQTLFLSNDAVFQDDNVPIRTVETVQSWFQEQEGELQHLPWPAQSPDLNIIEPFWSVLEPRGRNSFILPTSIKKLEDVVQEECYKIPLYCSELVRVHSKEDCGYFESKRWSNTMLIKMSVQYM